MDGSALAGSASRQPRSPELTKISRNAYERACDNARVSRWFRNDPEPEPYAPITPKIRHVWVEFPGGHGQPAPGIVMAWRIERQPSPSLSTGWSAQVAVVWAQDRLSIEWVSAEKLRPVREVGNPQ